MSSEMSKNINGPGQNPKARNNQNEDQSNAEANINHGSDEYEIEEATSGESRPASIMEEVKKGCMIIVWPVVILKLFGYIVLIPIVIIKRLFGL